MNDNHLAKSEIKLDKLRVLLVEDQLEARQMIRSMLLAFGITQVFEARDGRKALHFIDDAPDLVDVVICDWNMPEMNGVELLRQFRSVDVDTPFLMVSGRCDAASVMEARASGVSAYIRKPFAPDQLEVKLRVIAHHVANSPSALH